MFGKVKQAIRVGRHVTELMRLDCVYSCHKEADGTLCYLLYDWDERGQYVKAHDVVHVKEYMNRGREK